MSHLCPVSDLQLKHEMSNIIKDMIVNYTGVNKTAEHTWDYVQKTVRFQSFLQQIRNSVL